MGLQGISEYTKHLHTTADSSMAWLEIGFDLEEDKSEDIAGFEDVRRLAFPAVG